MIIWIPLQYIEKRAAAIRPENSLMPNIKCFWGDRSGADFAENIIQLSTRVTFPELTPCVYTALFTGVRFPGLT